MRSRIGVTIVRGLAVVGLVCVPFVAYGDEVAPRLEADAGWEASRPTWLIVRLVSRAPETVEVYESHLPWGNHYSLILEAVVAESGVAVDKYFPIDDPGDRKVQVAPGQVLSGEVDLRTHFVGIEKMLGEKSIVLFWSFELKRLTGPRFQRVGGWLLLPATARPVAGEKR